MNQSIWSCSRRLVLAALLSLGTAGCPNGGGNGDGGGGGVDATADQTPLPDLVVPPDLTPDLTPPPTCTDAQKNGAETDIDCGGGACPACVVDQTCLLDRDCQSALFCNSTTGTCRAPACGDGFKNGDETDVDCGGSCTQDCNNGQVCQNANDCSSSFCTPDTKVCAAIACGDGYKNGNETDVDCGGTCPNDCNDGQGCALGDDCVSTFCNPNTRLCAAISCGDGFRNGTETGVDCGGGCPNGCADGMPCNVNGDCTNGYCPQAPNPNPNVCAQPRCDDTVRNGTETGVDCGGGVCPACTNGQPCTAGRDCQSNYCNPNQQCSTISCTDTFENGTETDVDCGGTTCPGCTVGLRCNAAGDCLSGLCDPDGRCTTAGCSNRLRDGTETAVDCGGANCPACQNDLACLVDRDCVSNFCNPTTRLCRPITCTDTFRNGDETDVDCGGSCVADCQVDQRCNDSNDCVSNFCNPTTQLCRPATCTDNFRNGDETDVDCGGSCPGDCAVDQGCRNSGDCTTGFCNTNLQVCRTPSCGDGFRNGTEVGVDCGGVSGGTTCPGCPNGTPCADGTNCASTYCSQSTRLCTAVLCTDAVRNGTETDTDCGGGGPPICPRCQNTQTCNVNSDCDGSRGLVCNTATGRCAVASCIDGVQNNLETDVDCGGGVCPRCSVGNSCNANSDCQGDFCDSNSRVCTNVQCTDLVKNGNETGVDCGGGDCPPCGQGQQCNTNADCDASQILYCNRTTNPATCVTVSCSDGVRNGTETDTDCGGACPTPCDVGLGCNTFSDCLSGSCVSGACFNEASCRDIKARSPSAPTGVYEIDSDGDFGINIPFRVYCNMTIDGGGWTLITAYSQDSNVQAVQVVTNQTQITPQSPNTTNTGMRLPGVTEVLVVTDGTTPEPNAYDKWEIYSGVTNLTNDVGLPNGVTNWQDILDALNLNTGRRWDRLSAATGTDDPWRFSVRRVNDATNLPGSCLQVPLRGMYGDGNFGGVNSNSITNISSRGAIWHHWANETWFSGATTLSNLRCNQSAQDFTRWSRTVYLR